MSENCRAITPRTAWVLVSGKIKAGAGNYTLVIDVIKLFLTLALDTVGRNPPISLQVSQLETNGMCQNEETKK